MTFDECINVLRREILLLSEKEQEEVKPILDSRKGNLIVLQFEPYERSGRLSSPEFKAAMEGLYWLSR